MVSFRDVVNAFRGIGLNQAQPVIVHASLSTVGGIRGGSEAVLAALLTVAKGVLAPTFTYKTMIIPEIGPAENGMAYGTGRDSNRMAEFFMPEMPADPLMGALPEAVRSHPNAMRSTHPILSFAGINVETATAAQTIAEPLAPIGALAAQDGLVVLIGINHTANTSIHYAERLAGRKQFTRWALTPHGVRECPGFPGCSDGFEQISPHLQNITQTGSLGEATIQAVPLQELISTAVSMIQDDPLALLCGKNDERCEAVRRAAASQQNELVENRG